jgi:hypothetical protein
MLISDMPVLPLVVLLVLLLLVLKWLQVVALRPSGWLNQCLLASVPSCLAATGGAIQLVSLPEHVLILGIV